MAELKYRLMVPEAVEEAMRTWVEETSRLNRGRRASGAIDRRELAQVEKKIAAMIAVIEDGGYERGMMYRLNELKELSERIKITPGEKWGETHATLYGDLATIVDWTAAGARRGAGTSSPGLSLSVESGDNRGF